MADIPIVHSLYRAYEVWSAVLLKFPKSQRYALGETCSRYLLGTLELILTAASAESPERKSALLRSASAKVDTLKLLFRLTLDCQCIRNVQYLDMESRLQEIGKMLGGWIKSLG